MKLYSPASPVLSSLPPSTPRLGVPRPAPQQHAAIVRSDLRHNDCISLHEEMRGRGESATSGEAERAEVGVPSRRCLIVTAAGAMAHLVTLPQPTVLAVLAVPVVRSAVLDLER
jgi:hypothetical protein